MTVADPLTGRCARCGTWWDEHPGGFCPDVVGVDGMLQVEGAPSFVPVDEVPRCHCGRLMVRAGRDALGLWECPKRQDWIGHDSWVAR